jgi:hypothetical protein
MDQQPALRAVLARKQLLEQNLSASLAKTTTHAKRGYIANLTLLFISVGASATATVLGLFKWPSDIIGSIAMLSGFATLLATTFKFQDKADWYYDRKNQLYSLYNRLSFTGPLETDIDALALSKHIESIASDWSNLNFMFEGRWKKELSVNTGQPSERTAHDVHE